MQQSRRVLRPHKPRLLEIEKSDGPNNKAPMSTWNTSSIETVEGKTVAATSRSQQKGEPSSC